MIIQSLFKKLSKKTSVFHIGILIFLTLLFFALYKKYVERFAAFGCFDECFNYVAGYFILEGRALYSEIFFNHQPLMAYISALLQGLLHPQGIYNLVLQHRMFMFFFGLLMDIILIIRFGWPAVGFISIFETTKFYYMGSLFLGESVLVYPLVYMLGLAWDNVLGKRLHFSDYILAAVFAWFVIFLREPLVLAALFLYILIVFYRPIIPKIRIFSGVIFILLFSTTLLLTSIPDYIIQVIYMNAKSIFLSEVQGIGISGLLKIIFYPVVILTEGKISFTREILVALSIIFLTSMGLFLLRSKNIQAVVILIIILGLANLRLVPPGTMFYESFHMLPWYGLFIAAIFFLLQSVYSYKKNKKIKYILVFFSIATVVYSVLSPKSFLNESIDKDKEFKNFDRPYIYGEAIKQLSNPTDTLYLEWDDLIYWQAKLAPSYRYVMFPGSEEVFPKFSEERINMFKTNPPDFYYSFCDKGINFFGAIPEFASSEYIELLYVDSPSCLHIKKSKLREITHEQLDKVSVLRFYLPKNINKGVEI